MDNLKIRQHRWFGRLHSEETELARRVFGETLPWDRIHISDTRTKTQGITLAAGLWRRRVRYMLLWSDAFRTNIAEADGEMRQTFIHELVHVWQSQHTGLSPLSYMFSSAWQQFAYGVRDIYRKGFFGGTRRALEIMGRDFTKAWGRHRNTAYIYDPADIGRDFREFNVEQQALIVEAWFAKDPFKVNDVLYEPGRESETDPRFPYVRDCLRAADPDARYAHGARTSRPQ